MCFVFILLMAGMKILGGSMIFLLNRWLKYRFVFSVIRPTEKVFSLIVMFFIIKCQPVPQLSLEVVHNLKAKARLHDAWPIHH